MKSSDRSVFSRMSSWLRAGSKNNSSQETERLRSEQLRLSTELESLLSSYDGQTKQLASRLMASQEEPLTKRELSKLNEEQQKLWRIIRRLQASERTIPQLEEEYLEWKGRRVDQIPVSHPDHPALRAELIASELRARGRDIPATSSMSPFEGSAKDVNPYADLNLDEEAVTIDDSVEPSDDSLQNIRSIPISDEMQDSILEEIRECGRQLQKQESDQNISPQELAALYADLRRHHASLREADRRSGVRRYRIVLHQG